MKILYNGCLYETNESTKYIYIFNVMAKQIFNYAMGIRKEYNDILKHNDKLWTNDVTDDNGDLDASKFKNPTSRDLKYLKGFNKDNYSYDIPKELLPNKLEGNKKEIQIPLSKIINLKISDKSIIELINRTTIVLFSGRYTMNKTICLDRDIYLVKDLDGNPIKSEGCAFLQTGLEKDNSIRIDIPFFNNIYGDLSTIKIENFKEDLINSIAHELSHAKDYLSGINGKIIKDIGEDGDYHFDSDYEVNYSLVTELDAYSTNMFNSIEKYLGELIEKKDKSAIRSLMGNFDYFLEYLYNNKKEIFGNELGFVDYVFGGKNPEAMKYIIKKLNGYYSDLKSRYSKSIPNIS